MGGQDKGWVQFHGRPLVEHVLERLQPQVGRVMISANRSIERYRALATEVIPDDAGAEAFAGPLAGIAAALARLRGPALLVVPCDAPHLPDDLAARLTQAIGDAPAAVAAVDGRLEPLFCLLTRATAERAAAAFAAGERSVATWLRALPCCTVPFDDASAFANLNDAADLARAAR